MHKRPKEVMDVFVGAILGTVVGLAVGMFLAFIWLLHYEKRLRKADEFNKSLRFDDLKDDE